MAVVPADAADGPLSQLSTGPALGRRDLTAASSLVETSALEGKVLVDRQFSFKAL